MNNNSLNIMAENNEKDSLWDGFRALRDKWVEGVALQNSFIKKEIKRIKEGLELIPKIETRKRCDYLIEEKRKNLKKKAEFEFTKKLENDTNMYLYPGACNEIDIHLSELIKMYENYIRLDGESHSKSKTQPLPTKLSDLFADNSKYKFIMELLVAQGYCQSHTFLWKDDKKGNKGMLAAIIKYLHPQGYYKNNARPTNEEIKILAKTTFGWEMGIDTIKRANPSDFKLDFIPPASSIN